MGTRICGSSSRGVARRARAPRPSEAAMSSGVSLLSRKAWAIRPARPTRISAASAAGRAVLAARRGRGRRARRRRVRPAPRCARRRPSAHRHPAQARRARPSPRRRRSGPPRAKTAARRHRERGASRDRAGRAEAREEAGAQAGRVGRSACTSKRWVAGIAGRRHARSGWPRERLGLPVHVRRDRQTGTQAAARSASSVASQLEPAAAFDLHERRARATPRRRRARAAPPPCPRTGRGATA